MPIYEFECKSCKKITEAIQRISDPPPKACQHCGHKKIEKVISRTAKHPGQVRNIPENDLPASAFGRLTPDHGNVVKDRDGHFQEIEVDPPKKGDKVS